MEKPEFKDFYKILPSVHGVERIMKENDAFQMYAYALEDYIKHIEQKCVGESSHENSALPLHDVMASALADNEELQKQLLSKWGFTKDGGIDVKNQLKIFEVLDWIRENGNKRFEYGKFANQNSTNFN